MLHMLTKQKAMVIAHAGHHTKKFWYITYATI